MHALLNEIAEDPAFKKYQSVVKLVKGSVDPEKVKAEVLFLHKTRPSRELFREKMSPTKTSDAVLRDLSNRARMAELRGGLSGQIDVLDTTLNALKDHLLTKYAADIKEVASTADARGAFIRRVMNRGRTLKAEFESVVSLIDKLIEDIDKAGFSLTNQTKLITVVIERPGQLV